MKKEKEIEIIELDEFHEVACPACGNPQKKVKKKKETQHLKFECECGQKFSLTFPGDDWPDILR